MKDFIIKPYGKSELALLYFPKTDSPHTASNHLMSWIRRNPILVEELRKLGYRKSAKFFTPNEVALVVKYIGEP